MFYQFTRDSQLYPYFVLALNTRMQIGEILGLTWDCVGFIGGIIHVEITLCYMPNQGTVIYEFHTPKSKAGIRNIPMSKSVKEVLQTQKDWHENVAIRFQPQQGFENLVFTSKTNYPIHESNIRNSIDYLINRINAQNPKKSLNDLHFIV